MEFPRGLQMQEYITAIHISDSDLVAPFTDKFSVTTVTTLCIS